MISLQAAHAKELDAMLPQQAAEVTMLEGQCQAQLLELRTTHAKDVSELECALKDEEQKRDKLRQDRNEANELLSSWQREGAQLQQQYADVRQELLDLSTQARASMWRTPSPSPLDELIGLAEEDE